MCPRKKSKSPAERRRQAMMEAAYDLFIEKGYGAVTVDEIIQRSGGSKSSLYKFFGNKEGILGAVIEALANEMLGEIQVGALPNRSVRESLEQIGITVGRLALSANAINQYRLAIANVAAFPDLARLWFDKGPGTTFNGIAEYLKKEVALGRLNIENPDMAAQFLLGMIICKDNILMSIGDAGPSDVELKKIVVASVDVFLAAYGV